MCCAPTACAVSPPSCCPDRKLGAFLSYHMPYSQPEKPFPGRINSFGLRCKCLVTLMSLFPTGNFAVGCGE